MQRRPVRSERQTIPACDHDLPYASTGAGVAAKTVSPWQNADAEPRGRSQNESLQSIPASRQWSVAGGAGGFGLKARRESQRRNGVGSVAYIQRTIPDGVWNCWIRPA